MRRGNDARVKSSAGQVGSHGVRKSRLASRKVTHSAQSDICGARNTTPSPAIAGIRSDKLTVRKKAMVIAGRRSCSRGPADKTVGDRGSTFKPGAGTKRSDGGPSPPDQPPPTAPRPL